MGLKNHNQQYFEYKDLKETILNFYNPKVKSSSLTIFLTTKEEVENFINYFIEHGIKNKSLKEKMFNSFNDGNFMLDTNPNGENKHIFNIIENQLTVEIYKRAKLGDNLPSGEYVSDIKTIRGIVHELAHSSSQKFDSKYLNLDATLQKIANKTLEKDMSIGEIESKFMEKVFNDFILNHADEIEKSGCSINGIQDLEEEIIDLTEYDICDFLERLTTGMQEDDPAYQQSPEHRYVIGSVVSSLLFDDYKRNPEIILDLFNKYLENQCSMDIDEAITFLSRGKAKNFGQAVNLYKQMLNRQSSNQSQILE